MLRTSDILVRLSTSTTGERITLFEIVARIRARAFGVLLILFAAPNALPMPPGFSTFSAIFILLVAIQLMVGRTALWIPRRLGYKSVSRQHLDRVIAWIVPKLRDDPGDHAVEMLPRDRFVAESPGYPQRRTPDHELDCHEQYEDRGECRETRRHRQGIGGSEEDQQHTEGARADPRDDLEQGDALTGRRGGEPDEDIGSSEQTILPRTIEIILPI